MKLRNQRPRRESGVGAEDLNFHRLLDELPAAAYTCDREGLITYFNERAVELWGRAPKLNDPVDRFCGSFRLYSPEGAPIEHDQCWMALAIRENREFNGSELLLERPDGSRRRITTHITPIHDREGRVLGAANVVVDVTDSKRAEEALAESEERHRVLSELTTDFAATSLVDENGSVTVVSVTDGFSKLTGYSLEEMNSLGGWTILIHPEDVPLVERSMQRLLSGARDSSEIRIVTRGGQVKFLRYLGHPVADPREGRVTRIYSAGQDVTERRRAVDELRDREQQLQLVTNHAPVLLAHCDRAGRYRFVNRSYAERFGLTPREVIGKCIPEVVGEEAYARFREHVETVFAGEPVEFEAEIPYETIGTRVMHCAYTPELGPDGQVQGFIAAILDVTDRKRAEQALRDNEERFRSLSASSPVGIFTTDTEGRSTYTNARCQAICGFTFQQALGEGWSRFVHGDDRQRAFNGWSANARAGGEYASELRFQHLDGTVRWAHVRTAPMRSEDGRLLGHVGTVEDITERKQAEEELIYQRSLLQAITDNAQTSIFLMDREGRGLFVNPAAEEMTGFGRDELVGHVLHELIHHTQPDGAAYPIGDCPLDRALPLEEHVRGHEDAFVHKGGDLYPVRCNARPVIKDGEPVTTVIEAWDITKEKEAEETLRRHGERFRLLWESAAVLLHADEPETMVRGLFAKIGPHLGLDTCFNYMVDESGEGLRLEFCIGVPEETARSITRLALGETISGTAALHRRPIVATRIQQSDDSKAEPEKSFGLRAYVCSPLLAGGKLLGTLSFGSRTRDELGPDELEFLRTLCDYVTLAYERFRLIHQLREADRRKDEFLAILAHELRNPLAPLRNALELLKRSDGDRNMAERARAVMERQLQHMVRLIDDLLDISRISTGRLQLCKERVELAKVLSTAVETARPFMEAFGHELTVALPPQAIHLDGDPLRLAQVFANLLNNAAKYTEKGGHIWLTAELREGEVQVSVRDTGIGIAPEHLPQLFRRFSQATAALEHSQGGLGIGLFLVRGLVELHGGSVEAHSRGAGLGSEFTVRLPLGDIPLERSQEPRGGEECPSGPRWRILVADDNRDAAQTMRELLEIMGHEVQTAQDGLEAVQAAAAFRPDVVLLDIGMPGMDGYEAARRIREEPWGTKMLLIALTGWGQVEDKRRATAAGFDHHLTKPVDPASLVRLLPASPARGAFGRTQ